MRAKLILLLTISTVVAGGLGFAARSRLHGNNSSHPAFTLTNRVTHINPNDGSRHVGQEVRYSSSDGSFRVVYRDSEGSFKEYFFRRGVGFFNVRHDSRTLERRPEMSPNARSTPPPTAEELRSHPQFLRIETLLGLTSYVHRIMDTTTGQPVSDVYYTVELGRTPFKRIIYSNGQPILITEPINIIFAEPAEPDLRGQGYEAFSVTQSSR